MYWRRHVSARRCEVHATPLNNGPCDFFMMKNPMKAYPAKADKLGGVQELSGISIFRVDVIGLGLL